MMQRMQAYELERYETAENEWNEQIKRWKPAGMIRAAVSVGNGNTRSGEMIRVSSTHTAVTPDDVRAGDRFGGYVVDYVIPGRVYSQLFLTREDALREHKD